ncbi:MAG: hypothetical protein H8E68_00050 [Kiritimatiellaeota bacterium]|nr:hypothetical protein [Kiritimatiellota bacterium]
MRRQTTILLLLLVLSGMTGLIHFLPQATPRPEPSRFQPPAPSEPLKELAPFSSEKPLNFRGNLTTNQRPDTFIQPKESTPLPKRLLSKSLPGMLESRTGSYTTVSGPFQNRGPSPVGLRSDWVMPRLFPGKPLPSVHLLIIKDPATGKYQPVGGSLRLPGTGFEANYETELNSEDRKATLQWKISF